MTPMSVPPPREPSPWARSLAEARLTWPGVEVPDEVFADYVARRTDDAGGGTHLGDLYLACACARGDAPAIAAFDRVFLEPLAHIVARAGADAHVGAEVTQVLRERLLVATGDRPPRITEYSGQGSLAAWLRVGAVREVSKVRRKEQLHARLRPDEAAPPPTPEEQAVRERYGPLFGEAFREAYHALPAEERLILRLHFTEGLNLERLASALGFSRATAGRRLLAARTTLREETLRVVGARLDAPRDEVESVLRALRSHLDLSFGTLVSAA
jgi:RNA polymerase sigma-70 factor (ECF subfamily)